MGERINYGCFLVLEIHLGMVLVLLVPFYRPQGTLLSILMFTHNIDDSTRTWTDLVLDYVGSDEIITKKIICPFVFVIRGVSQIKKEAKDIANCS